MKLVSSAIAGVILCFSIALAQQPAGTSTPAPSAAAAPASGSATCPPASASSCPVQVTVNNNPALSPSPTPTPRPPKGSIQMRVVALKYDRDKCPCPDIKKTMAIAKTLSSIVPGASVSMADPGTLAIVWDESVSTNAIDGLASLAQTLYDSTQPPSLDSPAPKSPKVVLLTNHRAREIAHKLDNSVAGIVVAAIPNDSDDALVLSWDKDPLAAAVPDLLKIIQGLDAADTTGVASSPTIRLYNNRQAAAIAKNLNGLQKGINVVNQGEDMLILSGASTGNEGAVDELKRIVAVLDLPRPELALNLWSVQVSSKKLEDVNRNAGMIRETVNTYNALLGDSYDRGWRVITFLKKSLKDEFANARKNKAPASGQGASPGSAGSYNWLNPSFSDYVGKRFITCSPFYAGEKKDSQLCFAEDLQPAADPPTGALTRDFLHACRSGEYCLGYTFAFDPIKASLTNLLFALAAAKDPAPLAEKIVTCMESPEEKCGEREGEKLVTREQELSALKEQGQACRFELEPEEGCKAKPPERPEPPQRIDCEFSDRKGYQEDQKQLEQASISGSNKDSGQQPRASGKLHFACFGEELHNVFGSSRKTGLMRAAIADFLFHYKMSVEYPHDFVAYDLSHSADTLDSYFHPLLSAYNRDVAALLRFLQENKILTTGSFASEGIVSVSVISGNPASVDAKTANSFESTTPFTIAEFLNQLKSAESNTPALLKNNLTAEEANAIVAAFNVQKPTTISIGRDLSLTATAYSLATGSAADLKVTMASKDDGQPQQTFPSSGTKNDINPSRVASHTVDTIVRVESTKLFELSSLSAQLSYRGNSYPVPIIGELPWIGPAFRWPGTVHKGFHRSFAIISAVIVPNAADLALGMPFTGDRMLAIPAAKLCKATSPKKCDTPASPCDEKDKKCPNPPPRQDEMGAKPRDFDDQYHAKTVGLDSLRELPPQVREFHKEKLRCFISNDSLDTCKQLKFDNFPEDGKPGDKNTEEP
jgi:hypothetical protein